MNTFHLHSWSSGRQNPFITHYYIWTQKCHTLEAHVLHVFKVGIFFEMILGNISIHLTKITFAHLCTKTCWSANKIAFCETFILAVFFVRGIQFFGIWIHQLAIWYFSKDIKSIWAVSVYMLSCLNQQGWLKQSMNEILSEQSLPGMQISLKCHAEPWFSDICLKST